LLLFEHMSGKRSGIYRGAKIKGASGGNHLVQGISVGVYVDRRIVGLVQPNLCFMWQIHTRNCAKSVAAEGYGWFHTSFEVNFRKKKKGKVVLLTGCHVSRRPTLGEMVVAILVHQFWP
jgi:hypothetical protein